MCLSSDAPPREIVEAALVGLASAAFEPPGLRRVARHAGVSFATLLRYFRSRRGLLAAVVSSAERDLDDLLACALRSSPLSVDAIDALLSRLFSYAQRSPAVPKLLVQPLVSGERSGAKGSLAWTITLLRFAVDDLVREAALTGVIPRSADAGSSADLLFGLLFGALFEAAAQESPDVLRARRESILELWRMGLAYGVRARSAEDDVAGRHDSSVGEGPLRRVDLRDVACCREPLTRLVRAFDRAADAALLEIVVSRRSESLLAILERRGYRTSMRAIEDGSWIVEAQPAEAPEVFEFADLPAPEPFERMLAAVGRLEPGHSLLARVPRYPRPLIPRLEERGLIYDVLEQVDGRAIVHVCRPR